MNSIERSLERKESEHFDGENQREIEGSEISKLFFEDTDPLIIRGVPHGGSQEQVT